MVGDLHDPTMASLVDMNELVTILQNHLESMEEKVQKLENIIEEIKEITKGGAQVVIDFVGELGVENLCWQMVRPGGELIMVGYGGKIEVPTAHLVINEINIGGSLVGNYTELVELMELNADGKVKMHYSEYSLDNINQALSDFKGRKFAGRGVIVP